MSAFLDLVEKRRSIYTIGTNSDYTKEEIAERIGDVRKEVRTAFNSQTTRGVVLFDEAKGKFWDHIYDVQKDVLGGDVWEMMSGTITGSKNGIGTVLFFEDIDAVKQMPAQGIRGETYKQNNNANAQYAVWLAFTEIYLVETLQNIKVIYVDGFDRVKKKIFDLPDSYEMLAQMPFGSIEQEAGEKDHIDPDEQ